MAIALLYDVHGNLLALNAVLEDAERAGADSYLLGGDYATFGPWPRETVERLQLLPGALWIRGNGERWLIDGAGPARNGHELVRNALRTANDALGKSLVTKLYALPERAQHNGTLFCHGSPLSDVESFARTAQPGEEELLAGDTSRTVVFGHSHQQFSRQGPSNTQLVNPGSVGMPLDGDTRAAWALLDDGKFEFRRSAYDVERAATKMRSHGEWAEFLARRIENGSD
jgi:predicted phosphodiesterase